MIFKLISFRKTKTIGVNLFKINKCTLKIWLNRVTSAFKLFH